MMDLTLSKFNLDALNISDFAIPQMTIGDDDVLKPKAITKEQMRAKFLQNIGITGMSGVEGSGKTLLMTKFATDFHNMGGTVMAFEGYELKDADGKVISKPLLVEEWVTIPETLRDVLICIDEVEDHFNAQAWQSIIVRLFTGVFGQRRKRNMGILYTLQFFEELPKLMRRKTHYIIECTDAARYNPIKEANGERPLVPGSMTYTNIIDNYGKHYPFIPGYKHSGPIYHNKGMFNRYETDKKTDIFNQFTKIDIKRKVVSIDLNNDGVTTEKESIESQRLYDLARTALVNAFEKKKVLKGAEYWKVTGLNQNSPAGKRIAAELNETLGIEKDARANYTRDYSLVNA